MDFESELQQVAELYRAEGYEVVLRPPRNELPSFAASFHADLLARKKGENVLVQVKWNHEDLCKDPDASQMAEVVNAEAGWRFDLVVLNGKMESEEAARIASTPPIQQVQRNPQGEFTYFRARFLPFAVVFAAFALIAGAAGYFSGEGPHPNPLLLLLALPATAGLGAGIGILTVLYYRVQVAPWGIRSFDFFGSYHSVTWNEMVEVRPINILSFRYLRVYRTSGGSPLWLPLFLAQQQRFNDLIVQHTRPEHPLACALKIIES